MEFINLKNPVAEYNIIYHLNDCYDIRKLTSLSNKLELNFVKFESLIQHLNLCMLSSDTINILADVALESIFTIDKITIEQYINSKTRNKFGYFQEKKVLKIRFYELIKEILFAEKNFKEASNGRINPYKVYYFKTKETVEFLDYHYLIQKREEVLRNMYFLVDINNPDSYRDKILEERNMMVKLYIKFER